MAISGEEEKGKIDVRSRLQGMHEDTECFPSSFLHIHTLFEDEIKQGMCLDMVSCNFQPLDNPTSPNPFVVFFCFFFLVCYHNFPTRLLLHFKTWMRRKAVDRREGNSVRALIRQEIRSGRKSDTGVQSSRIKTRQRAHATKAMDAEREDKPEGVPRTQTELPFEMPGKFLVTSSKVLGAFHSRQGVSTVG